MCSVLIRISHDQVPGGCYIEADIEPHSAVVGLENWIIATSSYVDDFTAAKVRHFGNTLSVGTVLPYMAFFDLCFRKTVPSRH